MKVILQILSLFQNEEFEAVINIIPIQIEGLFADFLDNSLLYRMESDLTTYKQIYTFEFRKKAKMVETKRLNLGFETIGYFRYYFNSVYRNTVAHGNYWLLINGDVPSDSICDAQTIAILAHDLIFDLNYIIDVVAMSNEIDEAKSYLTYTAKELSNEDFDKKISEEYKSEEFLTSEDEDLQYINKMDARYVRLYLDLLGESRFNTRNYLKGILVSHEPVQLLFWIFNPIIEKAIGDDSCKKIRAVLLSSEFWKYVAIKLQRGLILNDGHTLDTVIDLLMPQLKKNSSVFESAIEVKKALKKLKK